MKSPFNQPFDIDVYFTIKYYADKHGKTITRRAKWTKDCLYGTHKKHGYPYINTLTLMQMELDVHLNHGKY